MVGLDLGDMRVREWRQGAGLGVAVHVKPGAAGKAGGCEVAVGPGKRVVDVRMPWVRSNTGWG